MLNRTAKDLIQSGPLGQSRIENLFYFNSMNGPFEGFGYIKFKSQKITNFA